MDINKQSRKWQVTINNPLEKGYTHEKIREIMKMYKGCIYWCMSDEKGNKEETYHTHIYICCNGGVAFSTMKKRFEGGHFEMCKGTSADNRDYVFKLGKWSGTSKEETRIEGTQEEFGECPVERQGARNDLADLYDMIKQGMSDYEILEQSPDYLMHLDKIDKVRQTLRYEEYKEVKREVQCSYIWGLTGTGKTRSIMEKYGYANVFRVTDYQHPFDNYRGQGVVVFEEFRSDIKFNLMLNYLDVYPLELPARFLNKYACYTKVYVISNEPISSLYPQVQKEKPESFNALLRRFGSVYYFDHSGVKRSTIEVDKNGFRTLLQGEYNAFSEVVE